LIDNLNYTYNANSNKILKVDDASNETASFKDVSGNDYTYSLDGSLKSDANKGITLIEYNYLKLPRRIVQNGIEILNQYDATGRKLKETVGLNYTDYFGNITKKNDVLYQISHDEGRIINGEYEYHIKDHLGNLRVAFRDSLGVAKITQANSYGIFGNELRGLSFESNPATKNNFKFLGRESLPEIGLVDLQKRWYDPVIGRFISIDPMPDVGGQESLSPYQYSKLTSVSDAITGNLNTGDFRDGNTSGSDYTYWADGSLRSDLNKGISLIEYNYLKLHKKITFSDGRIINFQYDASGRKLKETASNGDITDYVGNKIYKNSSLYQISHDEGRIVNGGYEYSINDHLGNLRVSFKDSSGIAKITQAQDYEPFGLENWTSKFVNSSKISDFKFNGIEKQKETNLYGWS
jgi:RHS repeat-associated protein